MVPSAPPSTTSKIRAGSHAIAGRCMNGSATSSVAEPSAATAKPAIGPATKRSRLPLSELLQLLPTLRFAILNIS